MKESLEATLKDVELTKEVYHLYTLEHLTQQEISVNPHCSHPLCNSLISNIRIF